MTVYKKLLLCLTVLSLTSCTGLKPFPAKYIYEIDLKNGVCGKYSIIDPQQLLFEHVSDLPLSACDGVFGFSSDQIGLVFDWSKTAIEKFNERCK